MIAERVKECVAMGLIGGGVLAAVDPRRHAALWASGPAWWRAVVRPYVRSPEFTRWVGVGQALVGVWLASRQIPTPERVRAEARVSCPLRPSPPARRLRLLPGAEIAVRPNPVRPR